MQNKKLYNHNEKTTLKAIRISKEFFYTFTKDVQRIHSEATSVSELIERIENYFLEGSARKKLLCLSLMLYHAIAEKNPSVKVMAVSDIEEFKKMLSTTLKELGSTLKELDEK